VNKCALKVKNTNTTEVWNKSQDKHLIKYFFNDQKVTNHLRSSYWQKENIMKIYRNKTFAPRKI